MGVCLLVVRRFFGDDVPTLKAYCQAEGISDDSIRRAARALLSPVVRLLRARRPGPRRRKKLPATQRALEAINSLLHALLPDSIPRLLQSAAVRGLVVQLVLYWCREGVSQEVLAGFLQMSSRQLSRWIKTLEEDGEGCRVPHKSRRPHTSPNQVPEEIQGAVRRLAQVCPGYSNAELTKIVNVRFKALLESFDVPPLSEKTVAKYADGRKSKTSGTPRSPRGGYEYPPPMSMAWIDTTHLKIAGIKVHIVVAMEAFSRTALAGEAVFQENTEVAADVLTEALTRAPGLHAVVRDRGTPYLNGRINDLLADHSCLPIDAHPYFPIDKAALERFFNTAKPWLRAALARLEEEWRQQGRSPDPKEVLNVVRGALQIFLRAYNLIPQPYLEAKCPFDRLEEALKKAGARETDLHRFHQLARERQDKDSLLEEVRDGLQLDVPLERMRRDFACIDKRALRSAYEACCPRFAEPGVRSPYPYLLAVARKKNHELLESRARARQAAEDTTRKLAEYREHDEKVKREEEDHKQHPERHLLTHFEQWLIFQLRPRLRSARLGERRLRGTLRAAARKLGAAYDAQIQQLKETIPRILQRLRPGNCCDTGAIANDFLELAYAQDHPGVQPKSPPRGLEAPPSGEGSCQHISKLVRQILGTLRKPHDGATDVCP